MCKECSNLEPHEERNFCPECGCPLKEPERILPEHLHEYGGKPIYVVSLIDDSHGWQVLRYSHAKFPEKYEYNQTWTAYPWQPKEA